jgi:hypothetical protein
MTIVGCNWGSSCFEDCPQTTSPTQFETYNHMHFSADAFAKHTPGIQSYNFCGVGKVQERDCRNNDKGVKNHFGVWFIPGGPAGDNPPYEFWQMKCPPQTPLQEKKRLGC